MRRIKCAFYPLDEFKALVNSLYEEEVYIDASLDGLYIGLTDDDLPAEDLHDRLARVLDAAEVTSIHIDDYEPCGVWVAYKDKEWILCSEALPEAEVEGDFENNESPTVLVTVRNKTSGETAVLKGFHSDEGWWIQQLYEKPGQDMDVVAWKPLPEAYREEVQI